MLVYNMILLEIMFVKTIMIYYLDLHCHILVGSSCHVALLIWYIGFLMMNTNIMYCYLTIISLNLTKHGYMGHVYNKNDKGEPTGTQRF